MAGTSIIAATKDSVIQDFTVTGPFWLYGDGFAGKESAVVCRQGNSGSGLVEITNKNGLVAVSSAPNTVYCDLKAGTYTIRKSKTENNASVNFEAA